MNKGTMKVFLVALTVIMLVGVCVGCGKSSEATKADELITAIGEVSLDSEASINTAQGYYDTLTDKQKEQVENYSVLQSAKEELTTLKAEEKAEEEEKQNKQIYDNAVAYEKDNQIDLAYAEYKKLPEGYEDVAERISKIELYVGVAGTWTCENLTSVGSNTHDIGAMFKAYTFTINLEQEGQYSIKYIADRADSIYTSNSILQNEVVMLTMLESGTLTGYPTLEGVGHRVIGTLEAGSSSFGTLTTRFIITKEGKLLVEYTRKADGTSVLFTYIKK